MALVCKKLGCELGKLVRQLIEQFIENCNNAVKNKNQHCRFITSIILIPVWHSQCEHIPS